MNTDVRAAIELQADTLVQEIERKLGERRQELAAAAEAEAGQIRQRARAKARRQLQRALQDMRGAERQRVQQLRAEIESAERRQASLQAQDALATAWPLLDGALHARWSDTAARQAWIGALLAIAARRWPAQPWTLRHPASLAAAELDAAHLPATTTRVADAAIAAGLVIEVDGARLDGTPAALLVDRPRVEAALLAALEPAR